jgi:membrane-bound lytic murein transglycosylase B
MYRWITRWRSSFFFQAGVFFFLVVPVFFIRIDGRGYQLDAESMSSAAGFSQWKVGFAREAIKKGIKPEILARVFDGVVLNERVIKADRYQPELLIENNAIKYASQNFWLYPFFDSFPCKSYFPLRKSCSRTH